MIIKIQYIHLYCFHACLRELTLLFRMKMIRTNLIIDLELEFDLALNSTSIKMTFCCISPNHLIFPCHDHASYCALH